jgi:hypothetical protein
MTKFSEWRIWNGGECPVAPDTLVQVQLARDTRESASAMGPVKTRQRRWEWLDEGRLYDIIAYRVALEPGGETVVLYWRNGGYGAVLQLPKDTHTITMTLIGGEPERIAVVERIVK